MKRTWRVYIYEKWGSKKDGWNVFNVLKTSHVCTLPDDQDCDNKTIMRALKHSGWVGCKTLKTKSLTFDRNCMTTRIYFNNAKNDRPEGFLLLEE